MGLLTACCGACARPGGIQLYNTKNFEQIGYSQLHNNQVTFLKMDTVNDLLLSCGSDNLLAISRFSSAGLEKIREIKNLHHSQDITVIEISVYHNLVVTAPAQSTQVFVWSYEFLKLLAIIQFASHEEVTSAQLVNGYTLLTVGTSSGAVYFLNVSIQNESIFIKYIDKLSLFQSCAQLQQQPKQTAAKDPQRGSQAPGSRLSSEQ